MTIIIYIFILIIITFSHPIYRYTPLDSCLLPLPSSSYEWPASWPQRLNTKPLSLSLETDAEEAFNEDTRHWASLVSDVYLGGLAINWTSVRNVMDMNAGYGGQDKFTF